MDTEALSLVQNFDSYRDIVAHQFNKYKVIKSYRIALAKKIAVHPSHLSHVLNGHSHLTLEQGMALCKEWNFSEDVTDYFLNLINLARSESRDLSNFYRAKLHSIRNKFHSVGLNKTQPAETDVPLDFENSFLFTKTWHCAAIVEYLGFTQRVNLATLRDRFQLSTQEVLHALEILSANGLVAPTSETEWAATGKRPILPDKIEIAVAFNRSLREKSFARRDYKEGTRPLQLGTIFACSPSDTEVVKTICADASARCFEIMSKSQVEGEKADIVGFCLDLYTF